MEPKPVQRSRLVLRVFALAVCFIGGPNSPTPLYPATLVRSSLNQSAYSTFNEPGGLAIDGHDNVYVADGAGNRVIKLSRTGRVLARWGTPPGYANPDSSRPPPLGIFSQVADVALDAHGNLYVADTKDFRIQELSPRGRPLRMWGTLGAAPGQFGFPVGVALDRQGNVYVVDSVDCRIQRFSPSGKLLAIFGRKGSAPGEYSGPVGIALDSRGRMYVTDDGNDRVQVLSPTGKLLAQWGRHGKMPGQFNQPSGIAIDSRGDVYVADKLNHRIEKFTASGVLLAVWGRYGSAAGDLKYPGSVAIDKHGEIYVTDAGRRVQKFSPGGHLIVSWH